MRGPYCGIMHRGHCGVRGPAHDHRVCESISSLATVYGTIMYSYMSLCFLGAEIEGSPSCGQYLHYTRLPDLNYTFMLC